MSKNNRPRSAVRPSLEESSAKLQMLRAQAQEALSTQRERIENLESELTRRIKQLAESFDSNRESSTRSEAKDKELEAARDQIAMLQAQLDEEAERNAQVEAAENRRLAELEQFKDQLASARDALEAIQNQSCDEGAQLASTLENVTHQRDAAVAESNRLQQENATLYHELALALSADETSSKQLAAATVERDELAARVSLLEQTAANKSQEDIDLQERLLDLTSQLRTATGQLDSLKNEIDELRQTNLKLQSGPPSSTIPPGALDWEAQKQRLLAMLDDEIDASSEISSERQQERATIADTMTITDRVLTEKEAHIAQLQAALEVQQAVAAVDDADAQRAALLNSDEIVAQERQRLQELNAELQSKMRAAELEMSLERAKLARERASLEDQISTTKASTPDGADKTKNRWRHALGLRDE